MLFRKSAADLELTFRLKVMQFRNRLLLVAANTDYRLFRKEGIRTLRYSQDVGVPSTARVRVYLTRAVKINDRVFLWFQIDNDAELWLRSALVTPIV